MTFQYWTMWDDNLTNAEKILLNRLLCFDDINKAGWKYFNQSSYAKLTNSKQSNVSRLITSLKTKGYIKSISIYDNKFCILLNYELLKQKESEYINFINNSEFSDDFLSEAYLERLELNQVENKNHQRARNYFISTGQIPWDDSSKYVLHHKDITLKHNDIERYRQWNIEDLEVMTNPDHQKLHRKLELESRQNSLTDK